MQELSKIWFQLSVGRRITALVATLAMFLAIFGMSRMVNTASMGLLYAGLDAERAGEVINAIEQRGIEYSVRGSSIFVPSDARDELRMTLASEGLPRNGSEGYELLDNLSGFGTTSQMFDAAYWRAKEGELARTIIASRNIKAARVHIAHRGSNPFERLLTPKASVAVTSAGVEINANQAKALKNLVASAVAGLSAEDVTVIGIDGGIIGGGGNELGSELSESRSKTLKEKVERILEARVGPGNVLVEATVDTNTESEEIVERRYDPEGRVAVSSDTEEISNNSTQAGGGQVTVASNLPDGDADGGEKNSSQSNQTRELINYEISGTEREILRAPGAIKKLSVAVLVNASEAVDENGSTIYTARSEDELAIMLELVKSVVGYDDSRGDVITLKSMEFIPIDPQGTLAESSLFPQVELDFMSILQILVLAVVTLILGLFVVRPILTREIGQGVPPVNELTGNSGNLIDIANQEGDKVGENAVSQPESLSASLGEGVGGSVGPSMELPSLEMMGGIQASESPAERLRTLIDERQSETVEILRGWLEEKEEISQ